MLELSAELGCDVNSQLLIDDWLAPGEKRNVSRSIENESLSMACCEARKQLYLARTNRVQRMKFCCFL